MKTLYVTWLVLQGSTTTVGSCDISIDRLPTGWDDIEGIADGIREKNDMTTQPVILSWREYA